MDVKALVNDVENSDAYKDYLKNHPEAYLSHVFCMEETEVGFYDTKKDKVASFKTNPIAFDREDDALKDGGIIEALNIDDVAVSYEQAMEIAKEFQAKNHPNEHCTKYIVILQTLQKQVYNITGVTMTFKTLNIKVDSKTGEIVESNLRSIMDLSK